MGKRRDGIIIFIAAIVIIGAILLSPIHDSDFTGLAYAGFSDPISAYTFNSNTNVVSVSDSAVYKYGYYSVNGGDWQPFNLTGAVLGGNWLTGAATRSLPNFGAGEHYVVIYSCTYTNRQWDCHGNQWQIITVSNTQTTISCTGTQPTTGCSLTNGQGTRTVTCNTATGQWTTGTCTISSCNSNYGNCDDNSANGCETNLLTSANNCGTCGKTCTSTCSNGQCTPTATCSDGTQNQGETGIDCGGPCTTCQASKGTGRTFYVSSGSGLDTNDGLSESRPWQTLSKVNSVNFLPGDTILFKRGDTFRGYLYINDNGAAGNPITFDAYGSGPKPRLWGSKDYSSSSLWTQYSGNVWRTSNAVTSAGDVANLIFNNEAGYGIKKTSLSACTSQGDWYIEPSTNRVYLYSASNPGNYYSHIEIGGAYIGSNIEEVIKIDSADYITIRNLDVRYSPNNGIIFMYGCNHGIVEYCDVSWIGGMYVSKTPPYRMGNGIGVWVDANDIIIRYNRVNQCYDAGISPQGGTGYTQSNIQMYYNIVSNTWYCYETWAESGATMDNVNFYNNVCVDSGSQWSAGQRPDKNNARHVMIWTVAGTVTNSNVKNNIFKTSADTGIRWDDTNSEFRFDNNLYYVNTLAFTNYGTYTTLSQWQSARSQDPNSISGDPSFMSSTDFRLQPNSPAINKGVNVGLTKDYAGNPITGAPDIGAYEFTGTASTTPTATCSDGTQNQGETGIDCGGPCTACSASKGTGPTYYISTTGTDSSTRDGSAANPWRTLAYACGRVTGFGSTIHVNPGTYIETQTCNLAVGVSIEGDGVDSIIKSNVAGTSYAIKLESTSQSTNGNQSISRIKMDGDGLKAYGAIRINNRQYVEIHDCTFVDFNKYGVFFHNGEPPTTWAKGNSFHDNLVINCAGQDGNADGNRDALHLNGQDGMLIYDNNITQRRSNGLNGNCIGGVEGFNKNVKIYNNILDKTFVPGTTPWDFSIEMWNWLGGMEIYNNTITGSVDIVMASKGTASYSVWVHDNVIGQPVPLSSESTRGVLLEVENSDVIIERNYIKNVASGIYCDQFHTHGDTIKNIYIRYNVFNYIGVSDSGQDYKGWGIIWTEEATQNHIADNINILNNVFIGSNAARSNMWGINIPAFGTATNINIKNNIIQNFDYAPIYAGTQTGAETIDYLSIENNIFYNNGNSNLPRYNGITPTHVTGISPQTNKIGVNPLFVSSSDFHLQAGSPAINAGVNVGLTKDYAGNPITGNPDIGALEYYP